MGCETEPGRQLGVGRGFGLHSAVDNRKNRKQDHGRGQVPQAELPRDSLSKVRDTSRTGNVGTEWEKKGALRRNELTFIEHLLNTQALSRVLHTQPCDVASLSCLYLGVN